MVHDVIIIGAGIVGMSVASALAEGASVAVLERAGRPGCAGTGRAVALLRGLHRFAEFRRLSEASLPFLGARHPEIGGQPLLEPRGLVLLARRDQMELMARVEQMAGPAHGDETVPLLRRVQPDELSLRVPMLRRGYASAALMEDGARDIDVPLLVELHRRRLEALGGTLICDAPVTGMERRGGQWLVHGRAGTLRAPLVINAAGAWADNVARMAGAAPVGLTALRRTVLELDLPGHLDPGEMPMVADLDLHFYMKPDHGRLLVSPGDETRSPACDPEPEELDVTLCLDRIRACFDLPVGRVRRAWAGLRCYAPDHLPVCGFDPDRPGFFWLAGQGGAGIQTSPALAALAASQIMGSPPDPSLAALGNVAQRFSPRRMVERA